MVQPTNQRLPAALKAEATDMAFFLKRQNEDPKSRWTSFNEAHTAIDLEVSTVGYMPIILAPAHDVDTLNTVVQRIIQVAESFNQKHIVLTVDQALFPLLMELKWVVPEYKDVLIPRLGGLHTSMNFLKVLGQHIQDSGLPTIWIESELKEREFGTYICMPFTRCCHFSIAMIIQIKHDGAVYLAQMKQLPEEVQTEFDEGNWVVKGSSRRFNQVDPDQSQEWLNGTERRGGGIVGIRRTTAALCRWTLSFNLRAHIAALTRKMYHVNDDDGDDLQ
ncbi:hypothetical protein ACROYT_G043888 [Oculina patagonica]